MPVLIEGSELPKREALPPSIANLIDMQARRVDTAHIMDSIIDLVKAIGISLGKQPANVDIQVPVPLLRINPLDNENLQKLNESFTRLAGSQQASRRHREN